MCYEAKMNTLCGGQLVGVGFFLPPMVGGIELRSAGLHNECPSPLNHLAGLILGSESVPSFSGTAHQDCHLIMLCLWDTGGLRLSCGPVGAGQYWVAGPNCYIFNSFVSGHL